MGNIIPNLLGGLFLFISIFAPNEKTAASFQRVAIIFFIFSLLSQADKIISLLEKLVG